MNDHEKARRAGGRFTPWAEFTPLHGTEPIQIFRDPVDYDTAQAWLRRRIADIGHERLIYAKLMDEDGETVELIETER